MQDRLWNVQHIQATEGALAAVLENGSVVTWGDPEYGSMVPEHLGGTSKSRPKRKDGFLVCGCFALAV